MTESTTLRTDPRAALAHLAEHAARNDPRAAALLAEPRWREAFDAAARHLFVPERIWANIEGDRGLLAVDRHSHGDFWWDSVYRDFLVVTQVDDGRTEHEPDAIGEEATSSISQPSLVLGMLAALDVHDGMRVLEIGTGSGWNAALLTARLGSDHVVSVEVDPTVADTARAALRRAGFHPRVVTGDGADGDRRGAPYDRILATCSVHEVPPAWIEQTRPGGIIVTPWATTYEVGGALARLTVGADGSASGPFLGPSPFMWMRAQRPPMTDPCALAVHQDDADDTTTTLDPREVIDDDAVWPIAAQVPSCRRVRYDALADGPEAGESTTWLADDAGSWAAVDYLPGAEAYPVSQYGPRRLWDEVETAWRWWDGAGRPPLAVFGLAIASDGDQRVYYRAPDGASWPL